MSARWGRASVAAAAWAAALFMVLGGCKTEQRATSDEDCKKSQQCRSHGRCAFDRKTEKCIVGTDADCAQSTICAKDLMCRKKGAACDR